MLHPLEQKIVALRRRVRRLAAVYGLSLVAAILLATVAAVLGSIDCLLRLEDRGVRIIASLGALGRAGVELPPLPRLDLVRAAAATPIWPCASSGAFPA